MCVHMKVEQELATQEDKFQKERLMWQERVNEAEQRVIKLEKKARLEMKYSLSAMLEQRNSALSDISKQMKTHYQHMKEQDAERQKIQDAKLILQQENAALQAKEVQHQLNIAQIHQKLEESRKEAAIHDTNMGKAKLDMAKMRECLERSVEKLGQYKTHHKKNEIEIATLR